MAGSPPRVRGKRGENEQRGHLYGITPACAGKPKCGRQTAGLMWDYPRACGENGAERVALYGCKGSPPRMRENLEGHGAGRQIAESPPRVRGKRPPNAMPINAPGITPACAGKTRAAEVTAVGGEDHPRVCGENVLLTSVTLSGAGSPPRVRGKQADLSKISACTRITPACAGKTRSCPPFSACSGDHPRVCGENESIKEGTLLKTGSPPRVRGKHVNIQG